MVNVCGKTLYYIQPVALFKKNLLNFAALENIKDVGKKIHKKCQL